MTISTGEFYAVAAILGVLIVLTIIAYVIWYYFYWRKRHEQKGFQIIPGNDKQQIITDTPKINLNAVEFTVPQGSFNKKLSEGEAPKTRHQPQPLYSYSDPGLPTDLGLLRPELYQPRDVDDCDVDCDLPPGNIGRVWFRIEYDPESEKLIVTVDKIRNLPGRQQRASLSLGSTSSCDPFIRLYLLPDEKRYLQSKMKRKTRNPTFNETFLFTMSYNLLIERTLRITVFDVDRFMRQAIIGHALYPLNNLDITMATDEWKDVEKSSQLSSNERRLQIGLTHFPTLNRVAVNAIRGQKIGNDDIMSPDSYVRITYSVLSKVHKVKKTAIRKNTSEPLYNQTVEFKIDQEAMQSSCLNLEVFHSTSGVKHDKLLGSFIIGGALCARGKELQHWESMMQKPQTVVKEWHSLNI